jgi:hypothetical protein
MPSDNSASIDELATGEQPRMMRLVLEVPCTDGVRDLVAFLAPLKHIAYRSDLWLTARDDSTRTSDNGMPEGSPASERSSG